MYGICYSLVKLHSLISFLSSIISVIFQPYQFTSTTNITMTRHLKTIHTCWHSSLVFPAITQRGTTHTELSVSVMEWVRQLSATSSCFSRGPRRREIAMISFDANSRPIIYKKHNIFNQILNMIKEVFLHIRKRLKRKINKWKYTNKLFYSKILLLITARDNSIVITCGHYCNWFHQKQKLPILFYLISLYKMIKHKVN